MIKFDTYFWAEPEFVVRRSIDLRRAIGALEHEPADGLHDRTLPKTTTELDLSSFRPRSASQICCSWVSVN
ncbi:MAG: hypothetical protein JWQ76_4007 [Ramlibacter sp.]|nr:hypothetical protein [Ramlibacter sp.]